MNSMFRIFIVGLAVCLFAIPAMADMQPLQNGGFEKWATNRTASPPDHGFHRTTAPVATAGNTTKHSGNYDTPNIPNQNLILQGGNNIADATVISSLPYSNAGTTVGFTDDYNEVCNYTTTGGPDVVYSFAPAVDTFITAELCNSVYDTKLYIYQNGPTPGSPVACNDDACGDDGYKSLIARVQIYAGSNYYIVVDGYNSSSYGYYNLTVDYTTAPPPPNDLCENVVPVNLPANTPITFSGNNTGALNDCLLLGTYGEVWEAFTTIETLDVTVDYCGTIGYSNYYLVLIASCPCSDIIYCSSHDHSTCSDSAASIVYRDLPPGTYYIPVLMSPTDPAVGPYTIHVIGTIPEHPIFKAHFMTPEGDPFPFTMIISDGEWRQEFDSVTYIETVVPESATYTYTYKYVYDSSDHMEMGQTEFYFPPGVTKEFEFYAIDPAQAEECSRPYIYFKESGSTDSLTWQWIPGENKLRWTLFKQPDEYTGLKIWIDADTLAPIDKYVSWIPIPHDILIYIYWTKDVLDLWIKKIKYWTVNIDITILWTSSTIISDSLIFVNNDPNNGTLGIRGVTFNGVGIDTFTTVLNGSDSSMINAGYLYPQYSIPPPLGDFTLLLENLPAEYVPFKIPLNIELDNPQVIDLYPPKLAELQPYLFNVVAENFYSTSSFTNLHHFVGDSISVDVSTDIFSDWWGSIVLPDTLSVGLLLAYPDTGGIDTLEYGIDWLNNPVDDHNLITIKIAPAISHLNLVYGPIITSCDYLIGDISGDGQRLGGDVTYGVRYLKGIGTPPRDSCFMDSTGTYLYVASDCNGNCEFRGSDITRLVSYFKGAAHLSCCHFFPTTLPPILKEQQPLVAPRD